jgi:ABC-2 type transport system permease protein
MSGRDHESLTGRPAGGAPTWWVIFWSEFRGLWLGGKALHLILIYSVLLGLYSFLFASNAELSLLTRGELMFEVVKASIAFSLFITLIIGAESISGERERATLEALLLTPTSRRQIVLGKFFAALSPWPVALAMSMPYWVVLAKGDPVLGPALVWSLPLGGLLAVALAGIGMLASMWCNTNRTSMLISIGVYLLLLLPTHLARPGKVVTAAEIKRVALLQSVNPFDSISAFLAEVIVHNAAPAKVRFLLAMPAVFLGVVLLLLFLLAGPALRLQRGPAANLRTWWGGRRRGAGLPVRARPAA